MASRIIYAYYHGEQQNVVNVEHCINLFQSSLQRLNMSSVNVPTTPKTPGSVKGSHKGSWYQSMNMDVNKILATPGSSKSPYYLHSRLIFLLCANLIWNNLKHAHLV